MHNSSMVSQLEQLPVISNYAGKPLLFTSLLPTISAEDSPALHKYWSQRYRLFSKYDQGIHMDKGEGTERGREGEREREALDMSLDPCFGIYNIDKLRVHGLDDRQGY